jgi:hypothetical protein
MTRDDSRSPCQPAPTISLDAARSSVVNNFPVFLGIQSGLTKPTWSTPTSSARCTRGEARGNIRRAALVPGRAKLLPRDIRAIGAPAELLAALVADSAGPAIGVSLQPLLTVVVVPRVLSFGNGLIWSPRVSYSTVTGGRGPRLSRRGSNHCELCGQAGVEALLRLVQQERGIALSCHHLWRARAGGRESPRGAGASGRTSESRIAPFREPAGRKERANSTAVRPAATAGGQLCHVTANVYDAGHGSWTADRDPGKYARICPPSPAKNTQSDVADQAAATTGSP